MIKDSPEEVLKAIVERYTKTPGDDNNSSDEEDQKDIAPVPYSEVLKALETLTLYEQQQEDGQNKVIRKL
jgi:hypothetical protein